MGRLYDGRPLVRILGAYLAHEVRVAVAGDGAQARERLLSGLIACNRAHHDAGGAQVARQRSRVYASHAGMSCAARYSCKVMSEPQWDGMSHTSWTARPRTCMRFD